MLPVIFTYPPGSTSTSGSSSKDTPKPICPSCSRDLSNSNHSVLLSSREPLKSATNGNEDGEDALNGDRPKKKSKKEKQKEDPYVCGHVICKTCADTIVKESGRCCVCEAGIKTKEGEGGLIPLGKEGTGFAAAGGAEVKRAVTTFRV